MPTTIRLKDLKNRGSDHHPYNIRVGISNETVDNPQMTMAYVIIPPGARSKRHYHANSNVAIYVIKGRLRRFVGPEDKIEEVDIEAGDFIFIPKGEIHGNVNLSDTEPAEMVTCYGNVAGDLKRFCRYKGIKLVNEAAA